MHPFARAASGILLVSAAFAVLEPLTMILIYIVVFVGVALAGIIRPHLRFVVLVTLPLLLALMLIWGVIVAPPAHGVGGVSYAFAAWLRIVVCGGVIQWLLLPLVEQPAHFRAFLQRLHMPPAVGTLLVTPILFLPEVKRRIDRIVDARKAQGLQASGLPGLLALPAMIVPLIASLMESALARAELWTHRGLLDRQSPVLGELTYARAESLIVVLVALSVFVGGALRWI